MNMEETIRAMIVEELDRRDQKSNMIPLAQFCEEKKINRVTVWRAEHEGRLKVIRIGRKVFVKQDQFI